MVVNWLLDGCWQGRQNMRIRLTKTSVEATRPGARDTYAWDDRVGGFGVKTTPKGARIYILKYRAGGEQRWLTLGRHGEITTEQARDRAIKHRAAIADGADPARQRDERAAEPTVDELADRYLVEWAGPRKRPRSAVEDRRNLAVHVRPELGRMKVTAVTRQDVLRLHHRMRATPSAANRVLSLLGKMFSLAENWGMRPEGSNPARRVEKYPEQSRTRFLSPDEMLRLGRALNEAEAEGDQPMATAAIRLLLLTGCRKTEILSLQWRFVDFDRGALDLPLAKAGSRTVLLGAPALALLEALPRYAGSPYVFPALLRRSGKTTHFRNVEHTWRIVRDRARLAGVRLHDLRHSFASQAVLGAVPIRMLAELLGHRQIGTTMKYMHVANDPLRAAADRVAASIAGAMSGDGGEVVKMPSRQPK
jgi:integrase